MGKLATVPISSSIQLKIQRFLLLFLIPVAIFGCRGPWFKRTDNYDPLVVAEQPAAKTPREFTSSRLRPANPSEPRAISTRPAGQSRKISDDSDELTSGDELSAEQQVLFRKQQEAVENTPGLASRNRLANDNPSGSAAFSMSDEDDMAMSESAQSATDSREHLPPAAAKVGSNIDNLNDQPISQSVVEAKPLHPLHPLSRDGSKIAADQLPPKGPARNTTSPSPQSEVNAAAPHANKTDYAVSRASATASIADKERAAPPASTSTDTPNSDMAKTDWRRLIQEALVSMQAEAASAIAPGPDQQLASEVKLRLLHLAVDDLDSAMAPIAGLQPHEQDYFKHQIQALHATIDPKGNPVLNRRWTLAMQSQRQAQMHLAAVSNLEIQHAAFCTEVDSFGIISKFPQYHFKPDQELLLYCELDNFVSEQLKDGFETQLQGSYEIVDSNGRRVADQLLPMDEHVCRNQRRDYFIAYRMYMPQDVKPGRYSLKLTIEDMKGHKFGQTAVDFQIVQ